jgi:hypothetical protein
MPRKVNAGPYILPWFAMSEEYLARPLEPA